MTTTNQYSCLNRLTSISPAGSACSPLPSFSYVYNSGNQRARRTDANGSNWRYEYDALGQVKSGKKYWPNFGPVTGHQFKYAFGNIGNRLPGDGIASALYEYGPFGELIRATGPMAKANPFRFSTKYHDDKSDLVYYGHRHYNPSTGRWNSRDPIGERGGRNLYSLSGNQAVGKYDALGLWPRDTWEGLLCLPCKCLYPVVEYNPGGSKLELGAYPDFISVRFGNRVHVNWSVRGNPRKCRYFQDEENAWARVDGISPAVPNVSTKRGINGNEWSREYTDPMGVETDWLWPGEFKFTVHWDVVFRCVSSDGTAVTRHDVFPDLVGYFTLAP